MKIFTAVIFLWVSLLNAQTTSIKILPIDLPNRPASLSHAISFSCTTDYDLSQCLTSVALLAKVLERYPTEKMGQWTFVLAGSARWKQTIKALGGDTESPAFSELDARVTVFEDELFETIDSRQAMLAQRFGLPPGSILDYAVAHEMGHAICGESQEKLADKYGFDLRRGVAPMCATDRKRSNTPAPKNDTTSASQKSLAASAVPQNAPLVRNPEINSPSHSDDKSPMRSVNVADADRVASR